ncbi:hypothetical protein QTN25_008126 [Entamoeba marina]
MVKTFSNCFSLQSINIPSSVVEIHYFAFVCCYSLTSITLPSSLTLFENGCFGNCTSLKSNITLPSNCFLLI